VRRRAALLRGQRADAGAGLRGNRRRGAAFTRLLRRCECCIRPAPRRADELYNGLVTHAPALSSHLTSFLAHISALTCHVICLSLSLACHAICPSLSRVTPFVCLSLSTACYQSTGGGSAGSKPRSFHHAFCAHTNITSLVRVVLAASLVLSTTPTVHTPISHHFSLPYTHHSVLPNARCGYCWQQASFLLPRPARRRHRHRDGRLRACARRQGRQRRQIRSGGWWW
jgi:hypothetical protein